MGAGYFGRRAVRELARRREDTRFLVVDRDPSRLRLLKQEVTEEIAHRCTFQTGTAAEVLVRGLKPVKSAGSVQPGTDPDWIVPAVPQHLAAAWYLTGMGPKHARRIPVPWEVDNLVPGPLRLPSPSTDLYTSIAQTGCPEDCPEPASYCPATGEPRPYDLFSRLAELANKPELPNFTTVVVRSHQLAPGVGGYRPSALHAAAEEMRAAPEKMDAAVKMTHAAAGERATGRQKVLLCTSCRCHGVVSAVQTRWKEWDRGG